MSVKKELKHFVSFFEKWSELDVPYFFRGGVWLFSAQAFVILSYLLLSVGFAHLTTKETYGQFQFITAVFWMLSILAMPGANTVVQLGSSENKGGVLYQGIRFKLKWCLLGVLGLLITSGYFYLKSDPSYFGMWLSFLVAVLFFPILNSLDVVQSFFAGRKKFSYNCVSQIGIEGGSALIAVTVLFFTRNLVMVIGAFLCALAVGNIVAFLFARRLIKNNKTDRDFSSYSFHLTAINFIPHIKSHFDKIIVTYFLGFASTAVYAIALAMGEQLYGVSKTVGVLVFPKVAEKKGNVYGEVRRRTLKLFLFFAVVAGIAALLAPVLIPFFFSAQYTDAVILAQLFLLVSVPRAVAFVLTRVLEVKKERKKLYSINLIYASVEIVALLVLIPFYGLYGIVGAKAVSNTVYLVSAWRSLR